MSDIIKLPLRKLKSGPRERQANGKPIVAISTEVLIDEQEAFQKLQDEEAKFWERWSKDWHTRAFATKRDAYGETTALHVDWSLRAKLEKTARARKWALYRKHYNLKTKQYTPDMVKPIHDWYCSYLGVISYIPVCEIAPKITCSAKEIALQDSMDEDDYCW
jgi:hypothetical protein